MPLRPDHVPVMLPTSLSDLYAPDVHFVDHGGGHSRHRNSGQLCPKRTFQKDDLRSRTARTGAVLRPLRTTKTARLPPVYSGTARQDHDI
ncbi:uncharacterized protein LOC103518426 isoform X2 [Diaphorina citri]|uniref:Uncharacterized protein LOC103518426 isoform X2 n=1 Tax=Diaphorina citri TaxID=121845 RepID=A0A1S3DGW5_DIACI|nr:uncharacterized protein LOC103518426 isoform X2 [Diaphorina citri]